MTPSLRYLPFHAERAGVETDADRHAANYALVMPLVDFLPRAHLPFRVEWVAARAGAVALLAGTSSPLQAQLDAQHEQVVLHLPSAGEARFDIEGRTLVSRAGETLLYLPGLPHRFESGETAGLSLGLDPHRLAAQAASLAGRPDEAERFLPHFLEPRQLQMSEPLVRFIAGHLQRVVGLIDLAPARGFELPRSLPLERLIEQAVAVLMVPGLAEAPPPKSDLS